MDSTGPGKRLEGHERALVMGPLHALYGELAAWRTDPEITQMSKEETVLDFVRGLRLSARLIYLLREILPRDLDAHWGHVLHPDGYTCSPECDVIIHRKGNFRRWNGKTEPVMDFYFIPAREVVAVVSCKSKAASVDSLYPAKCADYVGRVLLFAECCEASAADRLRKKADEAGYDGFWYLYTVSRDDPNALTIDEPVWVHFAEFVMSISADEDTRS